MPPTVTPNEEIIEFLLLCIEHNPGKTNFDEVAKESALTRNASAAYKKLYDIRRKFRQLKPAPDPSPSSYSSSSPYTPGSGDGRSGAGGEVFGTATKNLAADKSPWRAVKRSPRKKRCVDSTTTFGTGVEEGEDNAGGVPKEVLNEIGDWRSSEGFGARIG